MYCGRKKSGWGLGGGDGSVLILVLWVLFILAALTVAIGAHVSSAMALAERLWHITQTRALARAGARQALMVAVSQTNQWDGLAVDGWNRDKEIFEEHELGDGIFSVYYLTTSGDGTVVTNFGIIGEDGRVNLNAVFKNSRMQDVFRNLLMVAGEVSEEEAKDIIGEIRGMIGSEDDLTAGKDKDYYGNSSSKGADTNAVREIYSISDLRSLKSMDAELYRRLGPYITVYGGGLINLNSAPRAVLEALGAACDTGRHDPDVYRRLAERIVDFRDAGGVFEDKTRDAIYKPLVEAVDLSGAERSVWNSMIGGIVTVKSEAFRGVAVGAAEEDGDPGVTIEFVCDTESGGFVYWHEMQ
jgi:type II secretory pathway component PulK